MGEQLSYFAGNFGDEAVRLWFPDDTSEQTRPVLARLVIHKVLPGGAARWVTAVYLMGGVLRRLDVKVPVGTDLRAELAVALEEHYQDRLEARNG